MVMSSMSTTTSSNESDEQGNGGATPRPSCAFPVVGLGASAGGLVAYEEFFSGMPGATESGTAFVLVQHLAPDHRSMLSDLVKRHTWMEVLEVEDGMQVLPNRAYIIPPGHDMSFDDGTLKLHEPAAPRGHRLPIDFFFRSLAEEQGELAIGVVLSGTGSDGTIGMRTIKGNGGMLMVQSPETAEFDGMPRSAIATGLVDFVLPPAEMASALISYTSRAFSKSSAGANPPADEEAINLETILKLLRKHSGHDFSHYKPSTVLRRIKRRMALLRLDHIEKYEEYIRDKDDELSILFQDLLIGVTSFFRDAEAFAALEAVAIPQLFAGKDSEDAVRVWSAGCSTGEEAYSIAILLQEHLDSLNEHFNLQIFATDIDNSAIARARNGIYPASIAADVSPERLSRYFTEESIAADGKPESYRIHKKIRDIMIFSTQDVTTDPPFSNIDLISCRNLLIYLNGTIHKKLIPLFHYALRPGGTLFLGSSESTGEYTDHFHTLDHRAKLFQRKESASVSYKSSGSYLSLVPFSKEFTEQKRDPQSAAKRVPLREVAEKTLFETLAPASALVNKHGDVFFLHGRTGKFLEPATGEVGQYNNILKMAREGLRHELSMALRKVVQDGGIIRRSGLHVKTNEHFSPVDLSVCPASDSSGAPLSPQLYLVILEEGSSDVVEGPEQLDPRTSTENDGIAVLRKELRAKEEYLQAANAELETANEELKSYSEEMQSINEELQSTNEELETSKEELQSVNEELLTLNTEMQTKIADLSRVNNDMNNLVAGTGIATIFVDHRLCILRFTPATSEVINLIGSDVGRPVGHILSNLENYDRLSADIQEVLESLAPKEMEVRNTKGDWFSLRIRPYITTDNVIEGAVINFLNITTRKQKELLLREVHHRIKNNIFSLDSLFSMQIETLYDEKALSVMQDAAGRVKSMKVLYDKLLMQNEYHETSVKSYLEGLVESLRGMFPGAKRASVEMRIEDFNLSPRGLFPLGLIFNELFTNAMKYASMTIADGSVVVVLTKRENKATLTVQDNGPGLPEDFSLNEASGLGLTLVEMLSKQLGGSFAMENRQDTGGTKCIIEFDA